MTVISVLKDAFTAKMPIQSKRFWMGMAIIFGLLILVAIIILLLFPS